MLDLPPGANVPIPGSAATVLLDGAFDLSALVLGADGKVTGDADLVFYNNPAAPGVRTAQGSVRITPGELRRGGERVVVVASAEQVGARLSTLPPPRATLAGEGGAFARLVPPTLTTETALLLVEVYHRRGGWRLRALGQGYSDGLAGLARDFGVRVDDDGTAPADTGPPASRSAPASRDAPPAGSTMLAAVVAATNSERTRRGLRALAVDPRLTTAAQRHTEDMARRGFFAHESPDGTQVWDRAVAAGYVYRKVAENIAAGQRTADEVVRGWMDSPGHRANILDAELTEIGVAHVVGGPYGTYWTQVFGTPR